MSSTNHNNLLSDNKNKLTWTTKGKTSSDGETLVKTEGTVNITIPDTPELRDKTRTGSANQISPMSIASQTFDTDNSIYTIKYKWKHNMGTSGYIDGSLKVTKSDDNDFPLTGGSKNVNVSGLTHHSRSDLRTARLFNVGASVTIPLNTDNNDIGGTATDDKFYEIPNGVILTFGAGSSIYRSGFGPAQCSANPDDIIGVLTFTYNDSWIHVNPNTIQLTADGWSATPSIDIDSNAPANAKFGTVGGDLSIANIVTMANTGGNLSLTLSGLTKTADADNSSSITNKRSGNITYTFSVKNYIKNTPNGQILNGIESTTPNTLSVSQLGGKSIASNPEITYGLNYVNADYKVDDDNFIPSGSNPYTIKFGDISGKESVVSGNINANFPLSFNSWGGTVSGVEVNGIKATSPVNYKGREVKLNAIATAKYVSSVNNSTEGIDENHTYTQIKPITISQNGSNWPEGKATIQFYVDSCKDNGTPNGKSKPTITLGTSVMSFNNDTTNTTSITATSNESNTLSGGVTGTLNTLISSASIPASGGTVTITGTPNMTFINATSPATNSAFFRICGYMTDITGKDNINTIDLNDFGKSWIKGNATPPLGSKLVYCKEVEIAGKKEVINGFASTTATLSVDGGALDNNSFTFTDNIKQTSKWTIPSADKPTGKFDNIIMDDLITKLTIKTSGNDINSQTYNCTINDSDVTVSPNILSVVRNGINQSFNCTLKASGNTEYLKNFANNLQNLTMRANVTNTIGPWSFDSETYLRDTSDLYFTEQGATSKCINYSFTKEGGTKKFDIKQLFTEDTTTDRKKVTFDFTGKHEYGDGNWITEKTNSWTKTIDRTFTNPSFTLTKSEDGLPTSIFNYSLTNNTLTTSFKNSVATKSSSNVTGQPWNTNGFTNYFKATFTPGTNGDANRSTSITITSTDKDINKRKSATLKLTRPQDLADNTTTFTPTFNSAVSNNVIALSCDLAILNSSNTSINIYPKCTYDATALNSLDISVFNPLSTNNNITASFTLPIDTKDESGNYQLGAFDGGNYKPTLTITGIPANNDKINGNYAVNGKITCTNINADGSQASSTYAGNLSREFLASSIINGGKGTWSLDNTYGDFITWNADNSYIYINESNFSDDNIPENGVNVTLTYTMKLNAFGTKLNNGNSTVTTSSIIHIDGKHYVNMPWTDPSDQESGAGGSSSEGGGSDIHLNPDYTRYVVAKVASSRDNQWYIENNANIKLKVIYGIYLYDKQTQRFNDNASAKSMLIDANSSIFIDVYYPPTSQKAPKIGKVVITNVTKFNIYD